ncbi:tRNA pseudouridine synthase C [BD1-7 clade bacterium]|uniref:tRNA pseudouridine synthase C n=1 Tax=BD1-7 clade bacterium TaxID=2029982 RepID=A0A5S9QM80_9GAMM|nr:tRNA pseudouridine synthase C [BD1-7 clade bacterium]
MTLEILYEDSQYIAINKPAGLLVHRSPIDKYETEFAVQKLRDQISQHVHPVHRLDKPTSGVLLFAKDKTSLRLIRSLFDSTSTLPGDKAIYKTYIAVVRGYSPEDLEIDHPVKVRSDGADDSSSNNGDEAKPAKTSLHQIGKVEIPHCIETYPTSRYSLVELKPVTGRRHQLRYHMKHIRHPIIGDAKYGRGRHNRYFREHFDSDRLLLAATGLEFVHPTTEEWVKINAGIGDTFTSVLYTLGLHKAYETYLKEVRQHAPR